MVHIVLIIIYLAFIGLGLPDALLGAAWPVMYEGLGVQVSYAGGISMTIGIGTVISSLLSDRLTRRFSAGIVTAVSVGVTALTMFGFSISDSYWQLILWAIPYGLGAGCVDAALNNYAALHYASRHLSWLHAMWGIGTVVGPVVVGQALTGGMSWNSGYGTVSIMQAVLCAVIFISLPMWKKRPDTVAETGDTAAKPLALKEILRLPGAKQIMLTFFSYCAMEGTVMLWGSSYMVMGCGLDEVTAARFATLFLSGMTVGRIINGFITYKLNDTQTIRLGLSIIAVGVLAMLLPLGTTVKLVALIVVGLGCAPIYPSIIHSTPANFGADKSQAIIGVQMASAYIGSVLMPPVFGLIANNISIKLLPVYMVIFLVLMVVMHEWMLKKVAK